MKGTKEQNAALNFFNGCVFWKGEVKPWADPKKSNVSLATMMTYLNNAATSVSDQRARILYNWTVLFQHLSEAPTWQEQGRTINFQSAFVNSGAVERLVEGCFISPFSVPVSDDVLPVGCELTVTELACKVFECVFVGEASLHRRLVDGVVKLAELEGVPPELPGKLAELFGCFKVDATENTTNSPSINKPIEEELPPGAKVDSNTISILEKRWSAVLQIAGVGHVGDVGKIYQTLSALMGDMRAAVSSDLTSSRQRSASLIAELAMAKGGVDGEVSATAHRLANVEGELYELGRRKKKLTGEMEDVLKQLDAAQKKQKEIEKRRDSAIAEHREPLQKIEKKRSNFVQKLKKEEHKIQLLSQAINNLDTANKHISAKQNKKGNGKPQSRDYSALCHVTVAAARDELNFLLLDATKLRDRRNFCQTKLSSMQIEQQEMQALDFGDIARDITKGIAGLRREVEVTSVGLSNKIKQANYIYQWLSTVVKSRAITHAELADIPALHARIQALA